MCDAEGIHLYHIPELSSAEGFSTLSPVWDWEWLRESMWLFGSTCMTFSRHPMLYVQTRSETHTITFRVDASGRDPVVSEHRVSGELPGHPLPRSRCRFRVKGQKLLCYSGSIDHVHRFDTRLLGREELVGGFSAKVEDLEGDDSDGEEHGVSFVDFDERTTRILIAGYGSGCGETSMRLLSTSQIYHLSVVPSLSWGWVD